jgi:large subunit ribosomal protein L5
MLVCPTCKQATRVGVHVKDLGRARRCASATASAATRRSSADGTATETYFPRSGSTTRRSGPLKDELELDSIMRVPKVTKITLNMGVGDADGRQGDGRRYRGALHDPGQHADPARPAVDREPSPRGMVVGARVTLRGAMYAEFLGAVSISLPRIRDFGLSPDSFDGRGNYSLGIKEQIIFPEIDYDSVQTIRGLDIAITTSAENDEQARALLRHLGLPFATEARRD